MVEDLVQTYRVNMNLTVCFEANGPCMIIAPVLINTILPKPVCNWKTGFIDPRRFYIPDTVYFLLTFLSHKVIWLSMKMKK
jgi:hypothetical protein